MRVAWLFVVLSLGSGGSLTLAQAADEPLLKAAIQAQAKAWVERDGKAAQAVWVHDDKATRAVVDAGGYVFQHGWESINAAAQKSYAENTKPLDFTVAMANFVARQEGNLAFVEYDQKLTGPGVDPIGGDSHEYRVLIKEGGQWKIASQITQNGESFGDSPQAIEYRLNIAGYTLLRIKQPQDAIEIFRVNVRMNPESWNVYDSLGEAYAVTGQKDLAIQNYEKSLQLNPKNENGLQALAKLRALK